MSEISDRFKIAVKLSPTPAYKLAQLAGLDPSTLSKLTCGIVKVKANDPRILAVGRVLGLQPEDCFSEDLTE